jgi:hypothetical protein
MKRFLFLSRVCFILNLLFFVYLFLRFKPLVSSQVLISMIVIAGWFLSFMVNFFIAGWLVILLLRKEDQLKVNWMILFNSAVFIFQLLYFFS